MTVGKPNAHVRGLSCFLVCFFSKMPLFGFEIFETNSGSLTDLLTLTLIKRRERERVDN